MVSWWHRDVIGAGKLALLLCFLAFVVTFVVTRSITRLIRDGRGPFRDRVTASGTHVHHAVPGIVLLIIGAFLGIGGPQTLGWRSVAGVLVGVGVSLVLDEFALILHLQDVYWSEDGRTSVDAVFAAIAVAGLLILGFNPLSFFDIDIWREDQTLLARATVVGIALITLLLAVMVLLKGKVWTGLIGMFITPLLLIGAGRLSRPHAPWARWRYGKRPKKMHRALERERRQRRPVVQAKLWLQHVIAGEPHFPDDHEVNAQLDREVHPAPAPAPVAATTDAA
jgi:hypothetical protein